MSYKKYENGAWKDVNFVRKYENGAWQDVNFVRKYENGAWQDVFPNIQYITVGYSDNYFYPNNSSGSDYSQISNISNGSMYFDTYCDTDDPYTGAFQWRMEYPASPIDSFYGRIDILANQNLLTNYELSLSSNLTSINQYGNDYDIDDNSRSTSFESLDIYIYYTDGTYRYIDFMDKVTFSNNYGGEQFNIYIPIPNLWATETNGQKTIKAIAHSESISGIDRYRLQGQFGISTIDESKFLVKYQY